MRPLSDSFLLQVTEISAALIGLFLIGVFFYVESGGRRADNARRTLDPYLRASTRIVLVLFAVPIGMSLTLVAMEPIWARVLFVVLSLVLVAANIDSAARVRPVRKVIGSATFLATEVLGSAAVLVIVTIPWILGGWHPTREDFAWAILLSFATGFLSIGVIVMSAFDLARVESPD